MTTPPADNPFPDGPRSADHADALRGAVALVALAERGDPDAFATALGLAVADPDDAGKVVYGLVQLARFTVAMGMPSLTPDERLEVLEGMAADAARAGGT